MVATPSLWRHRDFMLLWIGQSVSRFGDQFTGLAIPVLAVFSLNATPGEMGLLGAASTFPFLLFGLLVGVWVDRRKRRSVLIAGDFGRGVLVGTIAALGLAGLLRMTYLYAFTFVIGVLTVFFDIAYQAYLPDLVDRPQLVDANSKLETTSSLAQVTGPAVAGTVITLLTAPAAMIFDAFSFFFSTSTLVGIRRPEVAPDPGQRRSVLSEVRQGLSVVFEDRRLRSIAACTATANFFSSAVFTALIVLYLKDALGYDPFAIGLLWGVGGIGGIAGAVLAVHVTNRLGVGPTIILGALLSGIAVLPLPFVTGPLAFPVIAMCIFATLFGSLIYNINQVSFRQAIVPMRLQGRLNATMRTIVWGTLPLGALVGGVLGSLFGLRNAIVIGVIGGAFAFLWVLFSPVREVKVIPESMP
jgi:MFS family permease